MKPITIEDLYSYKFLNNVAYNASGDAIAFLQAQPQEKINDYCRNIYLLKDGVVTKLTDEGNIGMFFWEDDTHILYPTRKTDEENEIAKSGKPYTCFYRLNINDKTTEFAYSFPLFVSDIRFLDNGKFLLRTRVDAHNPDVHKMSDEQLAEYVKNQKTDPDCVVLEEVPFRAHASGFISKKRSGLFLYDPTDKSIERLISQDFMLRGYDVCDNMLYYFGETINTVATYHDVIYKCNLDTLETEQILDQTYGINLVKVWGDSLLVGATDFSHHGHSESNWFYMLNLKTNEFSLLAENYSRARNSVGSDGRLLIGIGAAKTLQLYKNEYYFGTSVDGNFIIRKLNLNGDISDVLNYIGCVDDYVIKDDKILFVGLIENKLQEIYLSDMEGNYTQLTSINEQALEDKYVGKREKLVINSAGWDVTGWVIPPINYDPTKKYPAALVIHGGPRTVDGECFYHEREVWAGEGYFVFFCNPYGSDGYGEEFADQRGKYGTIDYQNIMDFTDAVLEKYPAIDKSRLCETGGSYGGFMTNWIITHTDRFCCAATQRSVSNWVQFVAESDIGLNFGADQHAAIPFTEEGNESLWKHSPLKYVRNIKTPTLVLHGDDDTLCPISNGYAMFTAMQYLGIDSRMIVFKGAHHDLSRSGKPSQRIRRLKEITNWFNKYSNNN